MCKAMAAHQCVWVQHLISLRGFALCAPSLLRVDRGALPPQRLRRGLGTSGPDNRHLLIILLRNSWPRMLHPCSYSNRLGSWKLESTATHNSLFQSLHSLKPVKLVETQQRSPYIIVLRETATIYLMHRTQHSPHLILLCCRFLQKRLSASQGKPA